MRPPILLSTIAIALVMTSCSTGRTTAGLSRSNGQKPHLGEHIARTPTDEGHEPASMGLDADRGSVPEVAGVGSVPISISLIDLPAPVLDITVPTSLTASTDATSGTELAAPTARRAQVNVQRGIQAQLNAHHVPAVAEGSGGTNVWAVVGFVCSFFIPLLGIIFSAIALGQIKRTGEKGHGLAIAGIVISILSILIYIAILA